MPTKSKKRGRKPGVKVRPYKKRKNKPLTLDEAAEAMAANMDWTKFPKNYSPAPVLTLCGQLEDSILLLENRISNAIAKINSLM